MNNHVKINIETLIRELLDKHKQSNTTDMTANNRTLNHSVYFQKICVQH